MSPKLEAANFNFEAKRKPGSDFIFGESTLREIGHMGSNPSLDAAEKHRSISAALAKSRHEYAEAAGYLKWPSEKIPLVRFVLKDTALSAEIGEQFDLIGYLRNECPHYVAGLREAKIKLDTFTSRAFALDSLLQRGRIPDDLYIRILGAYQIHAGEVRTNAEQELPRQLRIAGKNLGRILGNRKNGPALLSRLEDKLRTYKILTVDGFSHHDLHDASGDIDVSAKTIRIDIWPKAKDRLHTVTHEITHAIGGLTITKSRLAGGPAVARAGFGFRTEDDLRFRWLDEAMTEVITLKSLGREEFSAGSYLEYRYLLKVVLDGATADISIENFIDAYLEEYDPRSPTPIAEWKHINRKLDASYGAGMLPRLERLINERGRYPANRLKEAKRMLESGTLRTGNIG